MNEQADQSNDVADDAPVICGEERETPNGGKVSCTREPNHNSDHFDEKSGLGWPNEQDMPTVAEDATFERILGDLRGHDGADALPELEAYVNGLRNELAKVNRVLDNVGVPRDRLEHTFTTVQRLNLFVDRLSKRLRDQVENNMIFYNTSKEVLILLKGAPNSGQFRIRQAIEKLQLVTHVEKRTPSGLIVQ